ncbi:MAG TPA: hypothetical protein VF221_03230, partial [Chloroflexota bacterium]
MKTAPVRSLPAPRSRRPKSVVARPPAKERAASPAREHRPYFVLIMMALAATLLGARLAFWQVLQHASLTRQANREHAGLYVQAPMRGMIYDANDNPMATDVTRNLVYAFPSRIKDPRRTAKLIAPILGESPSHLSDLFTGGAPSLLLSPDVSPGVSQKINDLALPGIVLGPEIRRYYPERTIASQILGFADRDNKGQYGLERSYDSYLSGHAGLRNVLRDTAGNNIHVSSSFAPSSDGADLHLSIDGIVQGLAED